MKDLVDVAKANCTIKHAHIEASSSNVSFDQLKSMCANFTLLGQIMFVVNVLCPKPIIIIYMKEVFDLLLEADTKTWYMMDNDTTRKLQSVFFVLTRFDKWATLLKPCGDCG